MFCDRIPVRLDIRRLRLAGSRGLLIDGQLIQIVTTPCTFGGERRWFICPGCGRRCAVLRAGLRCNQCLGGRYRVEHLAPVDRLMVKACKLRRKLGQRDPKPATPIPPKPDRMRWHTYLRIRSEITRLERQNLLILAEQYFRSQRR